MVKICPNGKPWAEAAAKLFVDQSINAIRNHGIFRVALSGGRTPLPLYQLLTEKPYLDQVSWPAVHIFWADERCVPPGDPRSNFTLVQDALISHVPIPPSQVHPITGENDPETAARSYEKIIENSFLGKPAQFDLVILGLGEDGHTASLFPGSPALKETLRWVLPVKRSGEDISRITLTAPVFNQARTVVFLVSGHEKSSVYRASKTLPLNRQIYPL